MIDLDLKQRGVAKGMVLGALATVFIIFMPPLFFDSFEYTLPERINANLPWLLLPALSLFAGIAFIARHRFFTKSAIDGANPEEDLTLQNARAYLQNTTEQVLLFSIVASVWSCVAPGNWLLVVPIASCHFIICRALFAYGYRKGAPARAYGFAAPFYTSTIMMLLALFFWAFS